MNRERIQELIDIIKASQTFDMSAWFWQKSDFGDCGTPSCLAGHAVFQWGKEFIGTTNRQANGDWGYHDVASELLDLEPGVGTALFIPGCIIECPNEYVQDKSLAIQALENLLNGAYTEAELWPEPYAAYQEWLTDA